MFKGHSQIKTNDKHIIIEMRSDTKDALQTAGEQRVNLQKERSQLVEIVKEMRGAFKGRSKERGVLLRRLKNAQTERNEADQLFGDQEAGAYANA